MFNKVVSKISNWASAQKAGNLQGGNNMPQVNHHKGVGGKLIEKIFADKKKIDLVISPNEICLAHGTGVLLTRLMEGSNDFITIRSRNNYDEKQQVSAIEEFILGPNENDLRKIFAKMVKWLEGYDIRSILCAPYFETDLKLAIAAQAITGAPLGLWIMDDNCLQNTGIQRKVMQEAIDRSTALFAISPELKRIYQSEFGKAIAILPPLVAPSMLRDSVSQVPEEKHLVMIGNIWNPSLLKNLSSAVKDSGLTIKWLSSNPELWSSEISTERLEQSGIILVDGSNHNEVRAVLEEATCVIVPSDDGASGPHAEALGNMSLPTRIPFIIASVGAPIIVVSRPGTAAGSFVEKFQIGEVAPYNGAAIKAAFQRLSIPKVQKRIRKKSFELSKSFSFEGAKEFVFKTIESNGRWPHEKFEKLFFTDSAVFSIHIDKPAPPETAPSFTEVINFCDRLKVAGFEPDFILDIGSSTAIWSNSVHTVFGEARYILCDPMLSHYPNIWTKPGFELIEAAITNKLGESTFNVSEDLYGSSLIKVSEMVKVVDTVTVPNLTVDKIMADKKIRGRGLMKVDVQYAEHLVIEGALKSLKSSIDIVILELTLIRAHPQSKSLLEIANRMDELGFRLLDHVGGWRLPNTGELEQMDMAFVRKSSPLFTQSVADKAGKSKPRPK